MVELGVNIDHVATLRQARRTYEPDPAWAAVEAELGGADGITIHLREDRRHINDRDVRVLREMVQCKLNLEMSVSPEIIEIALRARPNQATLVPERRQEVTTEGGIDLTGDTDTSNAVRRLRDAGVFVSAFIAPEEKQIAAAQKQGYDAVELHTGEYANAKNPGEIDRQLERLIKAGAMVRQSGMRLHAGHGLNYRNVQVIAAIEGMREVNIGHAIVSRAMFIGLREAVREMKTILNEVR
jgi:pyridoxine 5-phosphate synthase